MAEIDESISHCCSESVDFSSRAGRSVSQGASLAHSIVTRREELIWSPISGSCYSCDNENAMHVTWIAFEMRNHGCYRNDLGASVAGWTAPADTSGTPPSQLAAAKTEIGRSPAFKAAQLVALPTDGWLTNGGNLYNQRYSPLTQINRDNVRNLKAKWRASLRGSGLGQRQIVAFRVESACVQVLRLAQSSNPGLAQCPSM